MEVQMLDFILKPLFRLKNMSYGKQF